MSAAACARRVCPLIFARICSRTHPVPLSTCSSTDLNSNREQWVETKSCSQLPCQVYLLSSPLANLQASTSHHVPLAFKQDFCRKLCQAQLLTGWPFGRASKENRVNLADSKSLHKLMYELEEWKNELWLMMIFFFFFDLNKSLLKHFSSVQLLLVQSCLC